MSITKDFEGSYHKAHLFRDTALVVTAKRVDALLTHARALEAMLKKHEWLHLAFRGLTACPECQQPRLAGHSTDCQLAKLLEGADDPPSL